MIWACMYSVLFTDMYKATAAFTKMFLRQYVLFETNMGLQSINDVFNCTLCWYSKNACTSLLTLSGAHRMPNFGVFPDAGPYFKFKC